MNFQDLIGPAIIGVIGLGLLLSPVLGIGAMLHFGSKIKREPLAWMFILIVMVVVSGPVASGRNLSGLSILFEADVEQISASVWINRIVNVVVLLLSVEKILRHVIKPTVNCTIAWPLFAAFAMFVLTNSVLNGIYGSAPALSHLAIYTTFATAAVLILAESEISRIILFAKSAGFVVLIASALAAIAVPSMVVQSGYSGGIFPLRYWGLGSHANTLSPLIVLMLCCLWHQPYKNKSMNRLAWFIGLTSLLATQSKTAIVATFIAFLVLAIYRYGKAALNLVNSTGGRSALAVVILIFMAVTLAILTVQVSFDVSRLTAIFISSDIGNQAITLSSRDQIWRFALQEWHTNPWFGYGPTIFEADYRRLIGLSQAYHAHNQVMHSLSAAGIVGVLGLTAFSISLGFYAISAARASSGLSIALLSILIVRSIAEVPLALRGVANVEYLFFAVTIAVSVGYKRDKAPLENGLSKKKLHNGRSVVSP